jgi:hypothetical protein
MEVTLQKTASEGVVNVNVRRLGMQRAIPLRKRKNQRESLNDCSPKFRRPLRGALLGSSEDRRKFRLNPRCTKRK